jgi:hypothetical protein
MPSAGTEYVAALRRLSAVLAVRFATGEDADCEISHPPGVVDAAALVDGRRRFGLGSSNWEE